MRMRFYPCLAALAAAFTTQAALADTALLLVNDRYDTAQNLREGRVIEALQGPLEAAGFEVIVARDASGGEMRAALDQLVRRQEDERVLIAVLGHYARSGADNWLLGRDADVPSLATVGDAGLSLSILMEVAGRAPGRAMVLLAQERRGIDLGAGLGNGVGVVEAPQGVTVLSGAPQDLAGFTTEHLLVAGTDLSAALADARRIRAFGFVSPHLPFIAAVPPTPGPGTPTLPGATLPGASQPGASQPGSEETALWNAATELDTPGAYRAYLARYPDGFHAAEAQARASAIETDPAALARAAEEALNLSRDQRQQIQRNLAILDYDTRGIDGIFGTGTRTAIQGWQTAQGLAVTGYLDADQIATLGQQASVRAAELEAAAQAAREAEERADRAYWQITGQGATENGLRLYLDRYPDGLYAEVAEERLDQYERAARAEAEAQDRAAWDAARGADVVAAYEDYIRTRPGGAFVDQARDRIAQLTGAGGQPSPQQIAQYEAREAALNLPPVTRSLIEQRLAALGLEPGRIDGQFDDRTRRAIRRYQGARGLDVTGYLDQTSVVRLLAESVGGILRLDGVINR